MIQHFNSFFNLNRVQNTAKLPASGVRDCYRALAKGTYIRAVFPDHIDVTVTKVCDQRAVSYGSAGRSINDDIIELLSEIAEKLFRRRAAP